MALVGYEWLIVLGILLVVFLWGPQKLPELARSIGLAKKEFDKAAKEASSPGQHSDREYARRYRPINHGCQESRDQHRR